MKNKINVSSLVKVSMCMGILLGGLAGCKSAMTDEEKLDHCDQKLQEKYGPSGGEHKEELQECIDNL